MERGVFDRSDSWAGRGEVNHQQVWRMNAGRRGESLTAMTAGWGGVRLADSRGGGWPLDGEGRV